MAEVEQVEVHSASHMRNVARVNRDEEELRELMKQAGMVQEDATQEEAIDSIQADFELQTQQLQDLTVKSQAAQKELNRYTQFIQNYELASEILADPIKMERKINNGTKHIMENIEQISSTIDNLDSGLQLQPNSN